MITLDDLPALIRKVERLKSESDKAQGRFDSILDEIRKQFGCQNLTEAKGLLEQLMTEQLLALKLYNRKYEKVMKKWGHLLKDSPSAPKKS